MLKQQQNYREKNKDRINSYHRRMRKKDPKRYYSYTNKWRLKNYDYFYSLTVDWKKKHPEQWTEMSRRGHAKHIQTLGWHLLYENPFDEAVDFHHITNNDVVAIPRDLHKLYGGRNTKDHRINLSYIVEQIYGRNCDIA
jgi:hypothetical protein